jgi:hypothetical protein
MQIVWVAICLAESYGLEVEAVKKPFGLRLCASLPLAVR